MRHCIVIANKLVKNLSIVSVLSEHDHDKIYKQVVQWSVAVPCRTLCGTTSYSQSTRSNVCLAALASYKCSILRLHLLTLQLILWPVSVCCTETLYLPSLKTAPQMHGDAFSLERSDIDLHADSQNASTVANATAKRPQSYPPACISTLWIAIIGQKSLLLTVQ